MAADDAGNTYIEQVKVMDFYTRLCGQIVEFKQSEVFTQEACHGRFSTISSFLFTPAGGIIIFYNIKAHLPFDI